MTQQWHECAQQSYRWQLLDYAIVKYISVNEVVSCHRHLANDNKTSVFRDYATTWT